MQKRTAIPATERALKEIANKGGIIRTSQAIARGIQFRTLRKLVDDSKLEQISRGIYRLTNTKPISNPDLFTVATRVPKAVICLISALFIP